MTVEHYLKAKKSTSKIVFKQVYII